MSKLFHLAVHDSQCSSLVVTLPPIVVAGIFVPLLPLLIGTLHVMTVVLLVSHVWIPVVVAVGVLIFIRVPVGVALVGVLCKLSIAILAILTILLGVPLLIGVRCVTLLMAIHF